MTRHCAFAPKPAMLSRQTARELLLRMTRLGIAREDLEETFMRGSGHGGQKVNKTSSCVHLRHAPTGIDVKCQRSRSRELNRYFARRELCDRIKERSEGERSRRQHPKPKRLVDD